MSQEREALKNLALAVENFEGKWQEHLTLRESLNVLNQSLNELEKLRALPVPAEVSAPVKRRPPLSEEE